MEYKYVVDPAKGIQIKISGDLKWFNPSLLKIGNLKAPSKIIEVLSVMFDLEGFTNFTKQVDPHLSMPYFVYDFFNWLFDNIRNAMTDGSTENTLWAELPFFCKFLGDGALFLWKIDLENISKVDSGLSHDSISEELQGFICNIIASMLDVCNNYKNFYNKCKKKYVDSPTRLRCGIARGNVFPVGNGLDFIGPCINISNRLQKLPGLSFALSARGIDIKGFGKGYSDDLIKKRICIPGIGDNEVIFILKEEFDQLSGEDKSNYLSP